MLVKVETQPFAYSFDKLMASRIEMVPRAGLEPARIAPHAPQTSAATNYATSAWSGRAIRPSPFQKIDYFFGVAVDFGAADLSLVTFAAVFAGEFVFVAGLPPD